MPGPRARGDGNLPKRLSALVTDDFREDVQKRVKAAKIDRSHDIPYLANRSEDGKTVYIDRHVPDELKAGEKKFDPAETLPWHELAEWIGQHDLGLGYPDAHRIGTYIERQQVELLGIDWDDYQEVFGAYVREIEDETIKKVPSDLDLAPYEDEHDRKILRELRDAAKAAGHAPALAKELTKMDTLSLFVPITKVDAAKRLIYGTIAEEIPDKSSEILDYASSKPNFEKWSADIAKASDGKSVGNLRAMHGKVAAGKLETLNFDDDGRRIEGVAKVVDDAEWAKVLEGVYTGFSIGGKYAKRWKDDAAPELTRYTAEPHEVSLVDNPCIPTATFEVVKADGTTELRKFKPALTPTATEPQAESAEVEQVWKAADGSTHRSKADAVKHNATLKAEAVAKQAAAPVTDALAKLEAALDAKEGAAPAQTKPDHAAPALGKKDYSDDERATMAANGEAMKDKSFPIKDKGDLEDAIQSFGRAKNKAAVKRFITRRARALKATELLPADWPGSTKEKKDGEKAAAPEGMQKGAKLYQAADLISFLASLEVLETRMEGGDAGWCYPGPANTSSDQVSPEKWKEITDRFGALLGEIGDLAVAVLDAVVGAIKDEEAEEAMEMAARIGALIKAGARHSKDDKQHLQQAHDHLVALGADCGGAGKAAPGSDLAKLIAERDALAGQFATMGERLGKAVARIEALEAQPMPPKGVVKIVAISKEQDGGGGAGESHEAFEKRLAGLSAEERNRELMKLALKFPTQLAQ